MANNKSYFNIALESLQHVYSTYLHNFWSTLGAALLFMGWILTSNNAREIIDENLIYLIVITFSGVLLATAHTIIVFYFFKQSQAKMKILDGFKDNGFDKRYYDNYELTHLRVYFNMILILCLIISDLTLMWTI